MDVHVTFSLILLPLSLGYYLKEHNVSQYLNYVMNYACLQKPFSWPKMQRNTKELVVGHHVQRRWLSIFQVHGHTQEDSGSTQLEEVPWEHELTVLFIKE